MRIDTQDFPLFDPSLAETPSLFTSVIGEASNAVMIAQRRSHSSLCPRIIYVNDAFTRITGMDSSEILGAPATTVVGMTRGIAGGDDLDSVSYRAEMFHKDGELMSLKWTVCKLESEDYQTWISVFHPLP